MKATAPTASACSAANSCSSTASDLPDEEEQFVAYQAVAEAMDGKPVTIRTLDLGADKQAPCGHTVADNPALGLRAIRLCLAEPRTVPHPAARHPARLALRPGAHADPHAGNFHASCSQTLQLHRRRHAAACAKDGLKFDEGLQVGGMIEMPAAALSAAFFAEQLDFLSIGTNDLIQYTLAIDRTDDSVAHLYDPLHPAVLQLMRIPSRAGDKAGMPVSVCGEMAGDARLTRLLLGLGLRQFSMHPATCCRSSSRFCAPTCRQSTAQVSRMLRSRRTWQAWRALNT